METIKITRTDRAPSIAATLKQAGTAIDLTGCTVTIFVRNRNTQVLEINGGAVTLVTPASGTVRYDWASGDVDTAGEYDLQWKITLPSGKVTHVPNDGYDRLVIGAELG